MVIGDTAGKPLLWRDTSATRFVARRPPHGVVYEDLGDITKL
jgi:hypothetical protein